MSAVDDARRTAASRAANPRSPGGFRAWTARRPLLAFLALALPAGWAILAVPSLAYHGVIPGREIPGELFPLALTVLVMLPAAAWVTSVTEGRAGVRALFSRTFRWRFGLGWWVAAFLALPLTSVAVGVLLGRTVDTAAVSSVLIGIPVSVLLPLVLVNLWEETVWAGFFQIRLERRHGWATAAALTAIAFAAIHLPMLFATEFTAASVLRAIGFMLVAALAVRLVAAVFLRGTGGSVLAVAVMHATWNASSGEDSVVDDLLSGGQPSTIAVVAVALVTAAAALVVRSRLARPTEAVEPRSASVR